MVKKNLLLILLIIKFNVINAQNFKWAQKIGSTSSDFAKSMALDNHGNIFLMGAYNGTLVFPGNGNLASRSITSAGSWDIYLSKMDCNKNLIWKNTIGSTGSECGSNFFLKVKYDNKGNLYTTGTFSGSATFTSTSGSSQTIVSTGGDEIFLAKYDTNGVLKWVINSGGSDNDEGTDCNIDNNGDLLLTGCFKSTATFRTRIGLPTNLTSIGSFDIFVAKYDTSGVLKWVTKAGSTLIDVPSSICADNQNNIYLGGNFAYGGGTATFGTLTINNTALWGGFIAKATSSGNWIWVNGMGGSANEGINGIVVDEICNVFITGNYSGSTTTFSSSSPGAGITITNNGQFDVNIAGLDSSGLLLWAKSVGGSGVDYSWQMSVADNNKVLSSGNFENVSNFGNGFSLTSNGGSDGFICVLDKSNGTTLNAIKIGGSGSDYCNTTITDNLGNMYTCGFFSNTASFGANTLTSSGTEDSYFAKLAPTAPFKLKPTNTNICSGDSVLLQPLDSMNGISFQWFKNNIAIAGATKFNYFAKTSGTFKLKVTNNCSEIDSSEEITLTLTNISVNAGIDATICRGDSVQLTASGATFYFWTPSTGISNANIFNPIVKPTDTINYIVRGISGSCIAYDTVKVNIKPILALAGIDSTICNGDSIRLNGTAIGTFKWESTPFLTDSNALNTFTKPSITTNFILKVTNLGCISRDTVKITVNSPTATAGIDKTICLGDSILLNGTGTGSLQWTPKNYLSDTSNIVTFAKPTINSIYYLIATIGRCVQRDTVQILVNQVFVQLGKDTSICKGDSIQLNATALGSFLWQTNASLTNPNQLSPYVKPQTSTQYILESTSGTCTKRDSINITVFAPVSNASTSQTICLGDSIQLNGSGANTLKWYPKLGLTDSLISNTFAKPTITTNYILLAQDGNCFARDTVKITVTQIAANAGTNKGICPGDSVQLSGSAIGSFFWETKTGLINTTILNPYVKPNISTYYVLTSIAGTCVKHDTVDVAVSIPLTLNAGANLEICLGDSVRLDATGGFNYNWIKAINMSDSTISNPFVKPSVTTDYIVKSGFSSCTYYDTVNVLVRPLPLVEAGLGGQICEKDSFLLNGSGQGVAKWNPGIFVTDSNAFVTYAKPSLTTTYYLTSNNGFCKNTDSVKVVINNIIPINAGVDQTICEHDTATLSVSSTGQIRWLNPQYLTDSTNLITKAFPTITTEFIAKSINTACPAFDTVKVIVKQKPIVDAGLDTTICTGTNYQLKGIATKGDIFNWEPALLVSNPGILDPNLTNPKTGFYKLTVQNSDGNCKTADSVKISLDSAIADFSSNLTTGFIPLTVQFTNNSINATKYIWNFESNNTSTQTSPSYTFENVGNYNVVLTAISKFGCIDTASLTIITDGEIIIQIPNVFTPNGDNLNDFFENKVNNFKFLKYLNGSIWNRWGQFIYEYQMPNGKWWDGKFEGNDCQEGVYFYIINAEGSNGRKFNFHGTVTLIR
jgi:gliding motility-associated-like protein